MFGKLVSTLMLFYHLYCLLTLTLSNTPVGSNWVLINTCSPPIDSYVLSVIMFQTHAHILYRSYGVLLYEFVTAGSVPYANFNNSQVEAKVIIVMSLLRHYLVLFLSQVLEGYRLGQPPACLDEFYSLMVKCWATSPSERPKFHSVLTLLLNPMEKMLAR